MKTKILHKFIGSFIILLLSCFTVFGQPVANYTFNGASCGDPAIAPPLFGVIPSIVSTSCGTCTIDATTGTGTGPGAYVVNLNDNHSYQSCTQFFSTEDIVFMITGAPLIPLSNFGVYFQAQTSAIIFTQVTLEWSPDNVNWFNSSNFTLPNAPSWAECSTLLPIPAGYTTLYFRISGFGGMANFHVDNFQIQGNATPPLPPGFAAANAGNDQNQCFASTINLQGNTPVMPAGYSATMGWTVPSSSPVLPVGQLPIISPTNTSGAIATINTAWNADYVYHFIYTITYTNGINTYVTTDDIYVQDFRLPDAPYGGTTGIELCITNPAVPFTYTMTGTNVLYGEGQWTQAPTNPVGGAVIANIHNAQSSVTFNAKGNYKFYWNTYNPNVDANICGPNGPDIVEIDVWQEVDAEAGPNQTVCWDQTSVTLNGSYTGDPMTTEWQTNGTGTFDNEFAYNAVYTLSEDDIELIQLGGDITLTWSVQGHIPPCGEDADIMTISLEKDPPIFTALPYLGVDLVLDANCQVLIPDATLLVTVADAPPCIGVILTQAPAVGDLVSAADGDDVVVVVTATDSAGNISTADVTYVAQDLTPPTWTSAPTAGNVTLDCNDATGLTTALAWLPSATDNCSAVSVSQISIATAPGCGPSTDTITRHFQATDASGNSTLTPADDFIQIIIVQDTFRPVLTPTSISACFLTPLEAENAALAATAVTDNCDPAPNVVAVATGTCDATVTVTATDACLNTRSITYSTRIDNVDPTILHTPIASCYQTATDAENAAIANAKAEGTFDDCTTEQDDLIFSAVATPDGVLGWCLTTVTLTVQDECLNTSTFDYTTRVDATEPVIVPSTIEECYINTANAYADVFAATTASDNCTDLAYLEAHKYIVKSGGPCTFTLTIYYVDECGNEESYDYTTRIDSIAPVLFGIPTTPVTVNCDAVPDAPEVTADDNCMGDVTASLTYDEVSFQDPDEENCGHYTYYITRTWTANDGCVTGPLNEVSYTQTIFVQDTTRPVWVTVPEDVIIDACPYSLPIVEEPTATDNCDEDVFVYFYGSDTVPGVCDNTFTVIRQWVAVDDCDNYINYFQHIDYVDLTPPDVTAGTIDDCFESVAEAEAAAIAATTAIDLCPGTIYKTAITTGECDATITVTATDGCANEASVQYFGVRIDNTNPEITCPEPQTVACAAEVPAPAADLDEFVAMGGTANDDCLDPVTVTFIDDAITNQLCDNQYTITRTYRVIDYCGHFADCTQTITVFDDVDPEITCPDGTTVTCAEDVPAHATDYTSFVAAGGIATDNCAGDVTVEWLSDDITDQTCAHQYTITRTYLATDICGNEEECTQIITVLDDVNPEITCLKDVTVTCAEDVPTPAVDYDDFVLQGGVASDNCVGQVTVSWISDDISEEICEHQYVITRTYRAFDVCSNFTDCTQIITVFDDVAPEITCPDEVTVTCASLVPEPATDYASFVAMGGIATDNCVGDVEITWEGDEIIDQTCPNRYTIIRTYEASDVCDNESYCTQTIYVYDDIEPTFTSPVDQEICSLSTGELYGLFDDPSVVAPTDVEDNCGGDVTFSFTINGGAPVSGLITELTQFPIGLNVVAYTAADVCGNVTTQTFTVDVTPYQQADAGPSQDWCNVANVYLLGNFPNPGYTAMWEQVSPASPQAFIFQQDNEAVADLLVPGVTYVFSYTLTNGPCTSVDTMVVTNWAPPSASLAGFDQTLCNVTTFTMAGNDPEIGEGTWMQISGPAVTLGDIHEEDMVVTDAVPGEYAFVWSIANGVCQPEVDEVIITIYPPVTIDAGPDATICPNYTSYTVTGATASNYDHLFWSAAGSGYFNDVTALNPTYYPLDDDYSVGLVKLYLTAYGLGNCPSKVDSMYLYIQDDVNPVITTVCSSLNQDVTLNENCMITVPNLVPSIAATDNCTPASEIVITQNPAAGELVASSHNGTVDVTITAADLVGNSTECTVVLTGKDLTAPVITNCEDLNQELPLGAGCKITIPDLTSLVTVNENCAIVNITQSVAAGTQVSLQHLGTTTVLVTVTDENPANAAATCLVTLTAIDNTEPTISAITTNPTFSLNAYPANCTLTIPNLMGSAYVTPFDNGCNYTLSQDPAVGTIVDADHEDLIPVVVTITDLAGLTAEATVTIEAVDANAPTVATPTANITVNTEVDLCSAVVTYVAPTFFDNCEYTVEMTAGLESGSEFPKGTTTVTYTATDEAGLSVNSSFTVTVNDNQAPVFTFCPENVIVANTPGLCGAYVSDITPVAWDNCPDYTVTQIAGVPVNALYPVGTTINTFRVTDQSNNTALCTFSVTVNDEEGPSIQCPELAIYPNTPGMCGAIDLELETPVVTDNCTSSTSILVQAITPEFYEYGINYVVWYATDLQGNVSECTQVVEVIDTELPDIDCPDNMNVTIGVDETSAVIPSIGMATATDNCWIISITNDAPVDNVYQAGYNYVTWTAIDAAWNESTCVQTIYVINPNYPAITCPGDIIKPNTLGSCGAVVNNIAPTEVGGNGTTVTYTLEGATEGIGATDASGQFFNLGVTTVTYTAHNSYGPDASCSFTVTIEDKQAPSLQCPPTVTVNVNAGTCTANNVVLGTPVVSDNCPGTVTWIRTGIPTGGVYPLGNTSILYTATDVAGNTATCLQTVTVVDNIPPVFVLSSIPANITRNVDNVGANQCAASGITPALIGVPTATDNCGTPTITSTGIIANGVYPRGVNNIIWTANDGHGNTATALTTITVIDNQIPNILCLGDKTVNTELNHCYATISSGIDPVGPSDNCSFTLSYTMTGATTGTGTLLQTGNSFQFNKGTTHVVYKITDAQGNVNSCGFNVIVNDNQKPTVTCPADVVVNANPGVCYATNVSLGDAVYSDNCGTATPTVTGIPINGQYPKGITYITYAVTDLSGNVATPCTQKVTVLDIVPPFFTNCPESVTVSADAGFCYASDVELGDANADDLCDGILPVLNNAPAHFPVGTTIVSYTVTDLSGNVATCTQEVTVIDDQEPTIQCPADITNATNPITLASLGSPVVWDNCGIASVVANIPFSGNFPLNVPTEVEWIVTDLAGLTEECTQWVTATSGSPVYQINGRMSYSNTMSTPMNNSIVNLTQDNTVVASTTTDDNGDYTFTNVVEGSYTVSGDIAKPWGGGNATDALLILRHFTSIQQLVDLPKNAADVNANGYINALDALLVAKRFTNSIFSFPAGDWVTEDPSVQLNSNATVNVQSLCVGDVNGSNVPPTVKLPATVNLDNSGNMYVKSFEEFELPVNTTSQLTTGAVSMVINYPANLFDVTSVRMADPNIDNMIYTVNNGTIRLAWYTTDKLNLNNDEALLILKLKAKDLRHLTGDVALTLDGVSEIADETGAVLQVNLNMPKLSLATEQTNVSVYPNPFQNRTEFVYTLSEQANVNIKVFDMLGNEVSTLVNGTQNANTYRLTFDASTLLPGVYTYKANFNSGKSEEVRTGRLVITK